jgi:molybdopterin-containing oxidoreductase family membrane subunit
MVLTLVIPIRRYLGLKGVITLLHLDMLAKLTLVTSLIVTFSYLIEHFMAFYSADWAERHMYFEVRPFGAYAPLFWTMITCNCVVPLALAFSRVRASTIALWIISILVNVGMWAERLVLIVTSQHRDFLPSSAEIYRPSVTDAALFVGSLGFFTFLFLLLLRFVPFIPIAELKEMKREIRREAE